MKHFRYALSSAPYAPETAPILLKGDICSNLKKAKELGYDAIEIHLRENDPIDLLSIQHTMQQTGVRISMIMTGRLFTEGNCSLLDDSPCTMQAAIEGTRQYIDLAASLGADIVIGWLTGNIPQAALCRRKYFNRLAANLKLLSVYAQDKNVRINIEVINRYEVNAFTTAKSLMDFIQDYHLENIYIHLDSFHMNLDECSFREAILSVKNKLGYFHLADNTRFYPGSGMIDFKEILKLLRSVNYEGYLSVECFPKPTGEEAAKLAIQYMKSIE
jgi:sugar phosphate isomerase/epimerase